MTPDSALLRQYAEHHDEVAFAELVRRHLDLVYSVALRQANGDVALAQDAAQAVFTDLVRKARVLSSRATLAGWLHTSARFAAGNAVRGEARRRAREHEAVTMHEITSTPDVNWEHLRPLLDESVGQLPETDRDAIVLRFFEGRSHAEIGQILGLSENSANKRVERALEKLREYFAGRGVKASSALLATAIAENSVQAAPVGLAGRVAAAAPAATVSAGLLGAWFVDLLLMNMKTKMILAVVVVLIALTATALYLSRPAGGRVVAADVPVAVAPQAPAKVAASAGSEVELPKAAPAPVAVTSSVGSTDPQADLNTFIEEMMRQLQSGNAMDFMQKYISPDLRAKIPAVDQAQMQEMVKLAMQDAETQLEISVIIQALLELQNTTPVMNKTGDLATYDILVPANVVPSNISHVAANPAGIPLRITFTKVAGKWYLAFNALSYGQEGGHMYLQFQLPSGVVSDQNSTATDSTDSVAPTPSVTDGQAAPKPGE